MAPKFEAGSFLIAVPPNRGNDAQGRFATSLRVLEPLFLFLLDLCRAWDLLGDDSLRDRIRIDTSFGGLLVR